MRQVADAATLLEAAVDEAADWPALWQDLVHVRTRAGAGSGPGLDVGRLRHRPGQGWAAVDPVSDAAAALFELYRPLLDARTHAARRPWVLGQLGQSLDGCIATAAGDSHFVTGPQSLLHLHRLRALCDAVLVGPGTVAADDPQLTTRHVPGPNPVRVVLDPAARLDGKARVLCDRQAPTWWLCDARHAARAQALLSRIGIDTATGSHANTDTEVLPVAGLLADPVASHDFSPAAVLDALAARGVQLLLVEGGGITVSRFLACGALDRLHLVVAPVLVGDGRRGLQGPARQAMADCPRPPARQVALGPDLLWDLDLRAL
jgi:riboflavin-specific deaminase-like protein